LNTQRVAILSYHKVGPPAPGGWETWFYINEATFTAQLRWLLDHNWHPLDLDTFLQATLRATSAPCILPEKSVLVTFDDGYHSLLDVAMPVLRRMNIPGVVFVPTDYVGGSNLWDQHNEPMEPLCGWDDLRTLQANGFAVQAHSASHPAFSTIPVQAWRDELERPRLLLERHLQRPVTTLAYPYGDDAGASPHLQQLVREAGYVAGFLYNGPAVTLPITDPLRIQRIAMGPDTDLPTLLPE
jgi:peptidoglycan/xylan/chitin deacetylase (PgdA/CDA1 family)